MKRTEAVFLVIALVALSFGAVGTANAATPGYVVYSVQLSSTGVSHAITFNESVSATSNVNYDQLILSIVSGNSTFSYSRSINSSLDVSPLLPSISNQSFSYASGSSSVSLSVLKNGSTPIQFQSKSYDLTSYALAAKVNSSGTIDTASGALLTFPSGLVYSVKISAPVPNLMGAQGLGAQGLVIPNLNLTSGIGSLAGGSLFQGLTAAPSGTVTLALTLLSTSLPLSGPTSSTNEQAASIGIGAGAVVSALALALGVRYKHKHQVEPQAKPEYSVD
jgi:hypothetical protein